MRRYNFYRNYSNYLLIKGATVNSISLNYTWNSSAQMANLAYRSINDPKSNVLMVVSTTSLENLTLTP